MKAREVRVTNPDLGEIGVKIIQPAKVVAALDNFDPDLS